MTADAADDRELLARHLAGDTDAFGELVVRHRDRLWRVALRTLGNADDAADAVQDAFVSAYRSAGGYRGDAAVTTWLHRITVNACIDLTRRRSSRPTTTLPDDAADIAAADAPYDAADATTTVMAALRQLPVEQAAAVVIVDVEGFSVREAAQILGAPEGTVKSRCARGRARLAELLSELGPRPAADGGNLAGGPPVQRPAVAETIVASTDEDKEGSP